MESADLESANVESANVDSSFASAVGLPGFLEFFFTDSGFVSYPLLRLIVELPPQPHFHPYPISGA